MARFPHVRNVVFGTVDGFRLGRGDRPVSGRCRSPPMRAAATAEVHDTTACSGPAVNGTGRSSTRWVTSAKRLRHGG
jgi:hypothetical protein